MKWVYLSVCLAIAVASGWFGRGLLDGSLISKTDAEANTAKEVKSALERQKERDAKEPAIERSILTVREAAKIVPSTSSPPGTGAISDDAAASMRDAFRVGRRREEG